MTIKKIHQGLIEKEFSAVELAKTYIKNIKEKDKEIRAFLTVTEELALSQAKEVDKKISRGEELPLLAGVPMAIKDNMLVENVKCTAASKMLENYIAPYDATAIKKLRERGSVFLGKTNLDEFAMGSSCENSAFFPTKNPRDLSRVPGGTSGGSAAAVGADMAVYALGSDTGGSIRQPASFCGIVGLKPTYGAVSRYGLIAMASSLDQIGPLTKTVEDAKIVFEAISGKDPLDATSVEYEKKFRDIDMSKFRDLRVGIPKEYFIKGMDEGVEKVLRNAIKKFEELGAKIVEISLPHTEYALAVYYIIMPCEVSANMARYDGIKYGLSKSASSDNLLDVYLKTREQGFGEEIRRRIMLGTYALSAGYYDAYYLRAQKVRTLLKQDFEKAFEAVDVILTPVSATPAFKLGEKITDPLQMYLSDIFTVSVNLAGLPAISVPAGEADGPASPAGGLPVGAQIIGKPFSEYAILQVAQVFEQTYDSRN